MTTANQDVCARPLTGRAVLLWVIAFFATISLANAIMIRAAVTTFGGVETGSAYQAGRMFAREVEAARAQETRHWQVKANVRRSGDAALIEIDARDTSGQPLGGLEASAALHHPTNARADHVVPLAESAPGHFSGTVATAPGQWDVLIDLSRGGERVFRSRNRVILK
jgi:nitrogen fixation protein FixH